MQSRRDFLLRSATGAGLLVAGGFPYDAFAAKDEVKRLTILHTNDVHSRLEAFPADGGKFAGQGGVAARASLIQKIRQEQEHVLLFDCGDIFQGTPYFNLYKGEPEMKAMSLMEYDAATMGNHDFDAGIDGFAAQLPHARFPILCANYDFSQTALDGKTAPYKVFNKAGLKIGVFGLGIKLWGLVPQELFGKTQYIEPIQTARSVSERLKKREGCDLVVCLSHLGYEYDTPKPSDKIIAKETEHIDLILGGHTHTFLDEPTVLRNKFGHDVLINQVGWAGLRLGRLDFEFGRKKGADLRKAHSVIVGE
jgi:5'-nucleotidase